MLKKTIISTCFIMMCILITGCSDSLKDENEKLKSEIVLKDSKITELEKTNNELEKQTESLEISLKSMELDREKKVEELSKSKDFYGVYTRNQLTLEKEIYFWTYIPGEKSIKQKLDILANALSKGVFANLPIEIVKIEETDGKRIAVINLVESQENQEITNLSLFKGKSWALSYFQGSYGGSVTSISLIETFLQRQYDGEWIDGVRFLYNSGKEINQFEHVPGLNEVNYRK